MKLNHQQIKQIKFNHLLRINHGEGCLIVLRTYFHIICFVNESKYRSGPLKLHSLANIFFYRESCNCMNTCIFNLQLRKNCILQQNGKKPPKTSSNELLYIVNLLWMFLWLEFHRYSFCVYVSNNLDDLQLLPVNDVFQGFTYLNNSILQ